MDSDDAFNEFIIIDEGDSGVVKDRIHITNEQYKLMKNFVLNNDKIALGRRKYTELWDNLSDKLNDIGPPKHPTKVWRQKCSTYKFKDEKDSARKKSKTLSHVNMDANVNASAQTDQSRLNIKYLCSDDTLNDVFTLASSTNEIPITQPTECCAGSGNAYKENGHEFQTKVLEKLDVIIHQQGMLIDGQNKLLQKQENCDSMLRASLNADSNTN